MEVPAEGQDRTVIWTVSRKATQMRAADALRAEHEGRPSSVSLNGTSRCTCTEQRR
jgi:hypothetical protein